MEGHTSYQRSQGEVEGEEGVRLGAVEAGLLEEGGP